ncbi:MAG: aminopeptidase P family protein [Prevotellaceae bacterium]|jgi:Xaa-Pro aminopeptidase|nr:aminopeptidase P family protein [Prevotellaceae bacterium]
MFSPDTYIRRRAALREAVGKGVLLFTGNDESPMNYADNAGPFRQDSTFLYYFGLDYAGLAAVIDIDAGREVIFGDELTLDDIVWMGAQPSLRHRSEQAGVYSVVPSETLKGYLREAAKAGRTIHFLPPYRAEHRLKLLDWLGIAPAKQAETASVEMIKAVVGQRNRKSDEEIEQIEEAVAISAAMHRRAIAMARPGMKESEIAAAMYEIALREGSGLSFPIIATVNGQILHNHDHSHTLESGRLMLIDAGAENAMHYAGDLSSTFPVDKTFTGRQRTIYNIRYEMHRAAVAALRPGVAFREVHLTAARTMVEGLKAIGLMRGDTDEAVAAGAYALFFVHGLGHMMGLDVHDMENLGEQWVGYDDTPRSTQFGLRSLRLARTLEAGYVHTIEPGIYFIPELIDRWRAEKHLDAFINYGAVDEYRNFGGIRNEEDYLITAAGARRLGPALPLSADEMEAARG